MHCNAVSSRSAKVNRQRTVFFFVHCSEEACRSVSLLHKLFFGFFFKNLIDQVDSKKTLIKVHYNALLES